VCTVSVKRNCDALQVKRPAVDSFVAVAIRVMIIVVIIQYILSRQYFYYIYTMPYICNTKITCRIHLIAPRHAFCFDLHDSKIQYTFPDKGERLEEREREREKKRERENSFVATTSAASRFVSFSKTSRTKPRFNG